MKNLLRKTVDITCIILEAAYLVISLPFKLLKALFDIVDIVKKEYN